MGTTIKVRFTNGVLEPLEHLDLKEGEEVTVRIEAVASKPSSSAFESSAGAWVGLVDCEELKRNIRKSRMVKSRPLPRLNS